MRNDSIKFALVAGEESGDILGADLIHHLKRHYPNAQFEGIGGKRMIEAGLQCLYPMERIAVMGFFEPLKRIFEILALRHSLKKYFRRTKPAAFIGIDAPDFNLSIEHDLKKHGIKTIHYVSPTVWAWRKYRIKKIKRAVDKMLSLFPFETPIYEANQVPISVVGHPLADQIPLHSDKTGARQQLELPSDGKIIALLPGSRRQELNFLAKDFIETAQWIHECDPSIQFIAACPNKEREAQFKSYFSDHSLSIKTYIQQATEVMAASDAILLCSGTATLQAMLVKRPTIVAYKMSKITFSIAKRIIKIPFIALPNLLANECVMPEFIQNDVIPAKMGVKLLELLESGTFEQKILSNFEKMHLSLRKNAGECAANEIVHVIKDIK